MLSVEEPVIVGSNVTFTFRPANYTEPHTLLLLNHDGNKWENVSFERLYNDANSRSFSFYIPNAEKTLDGKDFRVMYNRQWGAALRIKMCKYCNLLKFILQVYE